MHEQMAGAGSLIFPDPQLYVLLAILLAVAALIAAAARENGRLIPDAYLVEMTVAAAVGSTVAWLHLIATMLHRNDLGTLSVSSVLEIGAHVFALILLFVAVFTYYLGLASKRGPPSDLTTNPTHKT